MPEIRQTLSFLTISNRILERNFTYKVINSMNSLFKVAHITIKKNYFLANQIPVAKGDTISLSLQNNNEDKVTIFSGVIFDISTTNSEIQLKAKFRIVDNTIFNETYQDCTLEYALQKLLPSDKLKYEAQEVKGDQFILDGTKERSLKTQLKNHSYCLDRENCLVVFDKPKTRNNYIIDNCIKDIRGNQITIFPIPQLDLLDTVEYSNGIGELKKQKYLVRGLRVVGDYINMILDVAPYSPPSQTQEEKTEEVPVSKEAPEKYLYFENPEKLDELSGSEESNDETQEYYGAYGHFIKIAREVYQDYEKAGKLNEFQKIYITSSWRSRENQYGILAGKLDKKKYFDENGKEQWTKNTYEYYQDTAISSKYLKVIQRLYDGVYSHKLSGHNREEYLADLNEIPDVKNRKRFQDIIEEKYNDTEYVVDSYKKGDSEKNYNIKLLIEKTHVRAKLFNPSYHVTDTLYKNATALDIRFLEKNGKKYEPTAEKFYNKNGGNNSGYKGYNHYHMTP